MFRSIRWRIALPNVAVILLVAAAFSFYFSAFLRAEYLGNLEAELANEVKLVAEVVKPLLPADAPELTVQPVVERLGEILDARVTVVSADGVVLGDTHEDPAVMNNHLQRPEIQAAPARRRARGAGPGRPSGARRLRAGWSCRHRWGR